MNTIELRPTTPSEKYLKKWNEHLTDFVHLYVNGVKKSNTLYRVGGFGVKLEARYFMILKHIEEHYSDEIMEMINKGKKVSRADIRKQKRHLADHWTIIDNNGIEKKVFDTYANIYFSNDNGIVYHYKDNYRNIETDELYCESYDSAFKTKDFVFVNNKYDKDKSKRGVMKINKHDGTFELFPLL